jgi:hypothetical protein
MIHNEAYYEKTGCRRLDEKTGIRDIPNDERVDIVKLELIVILAALIACAVRCGIHMHTAIKTAVIKGLDGYFQSLCGAGGDNDALLDDFIWGPDENISTEQMIWFEELLQLDRECADSKRWPLRSLEDEAAEVFEMYLVARGDGLMTPSAVELAVCDDVIDAMYEAHAWLRKHYPELLESKPKTAAAA